MMFIYEPDAIDFSSRGIGPIRPTKAEINGSLNDLPTMSIEHPIDVAGVWKRIKPGRVIRVPGFGVTLPERMMTKQEYDPATHISHLFLDVEPEHKMGDMFFVIKKINYSTSNYLTAECVDICSDFADNVITIVGAEEIAGVRLDPEFTGAYIVVWCANAYKRSDPTSPFFLKNVKTDITKQYYEAAGYETSKNCPSYTINNITTLEAFKNLVEQFNGEWYTESTSLCAVNRVGMDKSDKILIEYGKNIKSLNYDENWSNLVNALVIRGHNKDENLVIFIKSPLVNGAPYPHTIEYYYDYEKATVGKKDDSGKTITEEMAIEMIETLGKKWFENDEIDRPEVSIQIDMVNYARTVGYEKFAPLQDIYLGDTVRARSISHGFDVRLRMTSYTYDAVNREYTTINLGKIRSNLYETISRG